jgi:hypothetical protein
LSNPYDREGLPLRAKAPAKRLLMRSLASRPINTFFSAPSQAIFVRVHAAPVGVTAWASASVGYGLWAEWREEG